MKLKHLCAALSVTFLFLYGCGGNSNQKSVTDETPAAPKDESPAPTADEAKGVGKFTNIELTHPVDENMVKQGQSIYDVKCSSCHKLTDEKLVGPGWKGVTDRRTPEWIMNFVTNTEEMLNKNQQAQAMLEVCMVRMPNQNLNDDDARHVLEFMRKNDGKN